MNKNAAIEKIIATVDDIEEPLFLLRGRDPLAAVCVMRWVTEAKEAGVVKSKTDEAERIALDMLAYHSKKLPD